MVKQPGTRYMDKQNDYLKLSLKLVRLRRNKAKEAEIRAKRAECYIFTPKNELEEAAIILATGGRSGWKGSLYSLDYYDLYLEHTCFIFSTKPKEKEENSWLLVAFDSSDDTKYWINLGEKQLVEIYYAWARVVGINNPQFNSQWMRNIQL